MGFLDTVKQKYAEGKKLYTDMQKESIKRSNLKAKRAEAQIKEIKAQTAIQKARNELRQARSQNSMSYSIGSDKPAFSGSIGGGSAFMGTIGGGMKEKPVMRKKKKKPKYSKVVYYK